MTATALDLKQSINSLENLNETLRQAFVTCNGHYQKQRVDGTPRDTFIEQSKVLLGLAQKILFQNGKLADLYDLYKEETDKKTREELESSFKRAVLDIEKP